MMIYSTSTQYFKNFLMTKENIIAKCFPKNCEHALIDLISKFSESMTIDFFQERYDTICREIFSTCKYLGTIGSLSCHYDLTIMSL